MKKLFELLCVTILSLALITPVKGEGETIKVTLNFGEGTYNGKKTTTVEVKKGDFFYNADLFDQLTVPDGKALEGFCIDGEEEVAFFESELYTYKPTTDITLNAVYLPIYTVTLDYNGSTDGIDDHSDVEVTQGHVGYARYSIPMNKGVNDVFAGWSTTPDGDVEITASDLAFMPIEADMHLYAVFRPSVFLTFDANGGNFYTVNEAMAVQSIPFAKGYKIAQPYPQPNKEDTYFVGWSYTKDGGVDIAENMFFDYVPTEPKTFYAVYEDIVNPTKVECNEEIELEVGQEFEVELKMTPENANPFFTLESTDASVVRVVDDTTILARRPGSADLQLNVYSKNDIDNHIIHVTVVEKKDPELDLVFVTEDGKKYWYENGLRQGVYGDPKNIQGEDPELGMVERGREIYDPTSDAWYWLDACYDGAAAFGKEVWVPYIYQNEAKWNDEEIRANANNADEGLKEYAYQCMKNKSGKWVRYDKEGKMLKGWVEIKGELAELYPDQKGNVYYYDNFTGLMAKGWITIEGTLYHFDEITGVKQ